MKRPVSLRPMDPARRRWYVGGIAVSIAVVATAWGFTMWRALTPEVARVREEFGAGFDKAAKSLQEIRDRQVGSRGL